MATADGKSPIPQFGYSSACYIHGSEKAFIFLHSPVHGFHWSFFGEFSMRLLVIIAIAGMVQVSTGSYAYAATKAGQTGTCTVQGTVYKCMADFTGAFWVCDKNPNDTPSLTSGGLVRCRGLGAVYVPSYYGLKPS